MRTVKIWLGGRVSHRAWGAVGAGSKRWVLARNVWRYSGRSGKCICFLTEVRSHIGLSKRCRQIPPIIHRQLASKPNLAYILKSGYGINEIIEYQGNIDLRKSNQ